VGCGIQGIIMEKKIDLILGVHCHQPVGNFEHVFEESYQRSYLPFMNVLMKHPKIKITFHYSGILLKWFEENHPEFLVLLKNIVDSNRGEILSGGFYEPIIITIPEEDRIKQIHLLSGFIKEKLGYDAKGAWLTERVWEPYLAKTLVKAGLEYTLVDDYHFKIAGLKDNEIYDYFTTEEEGFPVSIFPINEQLRYLVPFKPVKQCIDFLREKKEAGQGLVTLVDDGEKFGVWPGTYKWVYEEEWLENFFSSIEENKWIELITLKEAIKKHRSRGLIYMPPGSYKEMLEWSGGFWRNFLTKYPESNNIHKKMLLVSEKVRSVREYTSPDVFKNIEDKLFQGQCNDSYWHGIFGGLYLNYLRSSLYSNLIAAEADAEREIHKGDKEWVNVEAVDFDKDGMNEVLMSNSLVNLYVDPDSGGNLFEIDYKGVPFFNISDTLSRRYEIYHDKIKEALHSQGDDTKSIHEVVKVKKEGLEKLLIYDSYRKVSLIDHLVPDSIESQVFRNNTSVSPFVNAPYKYQISKTAGKVTTELKSKNNEISIKKNITLEANKSFACIEYEIENFCGTELKKRFGVEFNFSLLAGDDPDRYYEIPGMILKNNRLISDEEISGVKEVRLVDKWQKIFISLAFTEKTTLLRFPVYTVSQSEGGIEQNYQHSTIIPMWNLRIPSGGKWKTEIILKIDKI
jgi:4-alpha-glucanotransferase